jgi:hypothetical protein
MVYPQISSTDLNDFRLLARFGEMERMGTSTRGKEQLAPSDGAVFPTLLRTGKRGETFNPPCFTKSDPAGEFSTALVISRSISRSL